MIKGIVESQIQQTITTNQTNDPAAGNHMSMNDPEWGRNSSGGQGRDKENNSGEQEPRQPQGANQNNGKDGPPDLDELWRDFNAKLNRLFGKKGGNGGPRPPFGGGLPTGGNSAGPSALLGVGLAIFVLIWLGSGFFIVQEGREAVVLQFGKYHHTALPGFQWRLPYPIQSHQTINSSEIRTAEVGFRNSDSRSKVNRESLMLTKDQNIIDIQFTVQYRIKSAMEYLFSTVDPDETVKMAAETSIREIVGGNVMDFVLYEGREQIALQTAKSIQEILDRYKTGLLVSTVEVSKVQPPEQVQAAFDDVVKAGQDAERSKNEANAYRNDVIPRARGNASRLLEEAEGYKQRVVSQAEGDSERFKSILVEYERSPKVTRERMYIDTMQQVYSGINKVIVDTRNSSQMLYLPLDKILEKTTADANAAAGVNGGQAAPGASPPYKPRTDGEGAKPADTDASFRDSLRNRDRGAR